MTLLNIPGTLKYVSDRAGGLGSVCNVQAAFHSGPDNQPAQFHAFDGSIGKRSSAPLLCGISTGSRSTVGDKSLPAHLRGQTSEINFTRNPCSRRSELINLYDKFDNQSNLIGSNPTVRMRELVGPSHMCLGILLLVLKDLWSARLVSIIT